MQGSFLGEGFELVHVELFRFPEDWTSFWIDVVHNDPKDEGGELDDSFRLLASLTDSFDHVGDIISPFVDSIIGGNSVDGLQHVQLEVVASTF